jgi:hypothetical protein
MRRHPFLALLIVVAAAAILAYAGWTIAVAARLGEGWAGLGSAWPFLLAGVVTVGLAIAGFLRLAFFSEHHGFDERADINRH